MIFHVTLECAENCWVVDECPALPGKSRCLSLGNTKFWGALTVSMQIEGGGTHTPYPLFLEGI